MHSSINQIVQKYIHKKLRHESFDELYRRKGKTISYNLPQIIDPQKQKQKNTIFKLQQKLINKDIKHKSVTNWFSHKKSIESRLFTDIHQRQKVNKQQDVLTIQTHKKKLQAYSQICRDKYKQEIQNNKLRPSKFDKQKKSQSEININNKMSIEPLDQQFYVESSLKLYPKRSTHSQFYKTSKYRNKFMIKVNNNIVLLNDKQEGKTRSKMQNPLYCTFY